VAWCILLWWERWPRADGWKGLHLCFSLVWGTLPVMLMVSLAGNFIGLGVRKRVNKLIPAFMIVIACLFILRGLNLGIPYISPQLQQSEITDDSVICH
jgi:sulfite exporter TauE/SafE